MDAGRPGPGAAALRAAAVAALRGLTVAPAGLRGVARPDEGSCAGPLKGRPWTRAWGCG